MDLLRNIDFWGTTTSLLCAIHCALLPFLLAGGAIGSHTWLQSPVFEVIVLGLTSIFVYFSIIKPYLSKKENKFSFYLASLGLILILIHHSLPFGGNVVIVLGGLAVAVAHIIKLNLVSHSH